jgi:hypothetical protein
MNEDLRLHREAELYMGLAAKASAQSRPEDARKFNRQAAELEAQVFDLLPLDRPRTRGITAVSSVALFRKAEAFDQAINHAHYFLNQKCLSEPSRDDLKEMILATKIGLAEEIMSIEKRYRRLRQSNCRKAAELAYILAESYAAGGAHATAIEYAFEGLELLDSVHMTSVDDAAPVFHREYEAVGLIEPNWISSHRLLDLIQRLAPDGPLVETASPA